MTSIIINLNKSMKQIIFLIILFCLVKDTFSQESVRYDEIKLETKEDYNEFSNNAALQAANYLLSTPTDSKNILRLQSLQYVIRWMAGTPEFSFTLDAAITKLGKNNDMLLGLYMAAMTKYVLENRAESTNQNAIKLYAFKLIILYSKDPKNNVKITKDLRKAIDAYDNGKLDDYLN